MATTSADALPLVDGREHPVMRWGAIFAGWFVATASAMVLYTFGLAVGFSAINPNDAAAVTHGISAGTIVWLILTWTASLWIGGMFASWFDGRNDTEMGVVRGLTVWGLSVTVTALLVARGLGHVRPLPPAAAPPIDPALLARYVAAAMWTFFASAVVSLVAAAFGGWLGAHHVHRVYHLRRYRTHGQQ